MLHHYITRYQDENDDDWVAAWLQLDLFDWHFCFWKRRKKIEPSK